MTIPFYKENTSVFDVEKVFKQNKGVARNRDSLFVALKKPHRGIFSQTLSRWIKKILMESEMDTEVFDACTVFVMHQLPQQKEVELT